MRACWYIMMSLAVLASGCASKQRCREHSCPGAGVAFECERVERRVLMADVSRESFQEAGARAYCNLPEKEAQCLAAMNAPQARLLEQEAEAVAAQPSGDHRRNSNGAKAEALRLQGGHERNRRA